MSRLEVVRLLNIPDLLGRPDAGLDDIDADSLGNIYISDGLNRRVYKVLSDGESFDSFDLSQAIPLGNGDSILNLSILPDSTFCVADPMMEMIIRYDEQGFYTGEFTAPGVLSLCQGPEGSLYVLSDDEDIERIFRYDDFGFQIDTLAAPARHRGKLDSSLAKIASDSEGNVFVSYGMPPYRIWKVRADGSEIDAWGMESDHPEDAVLIADIAFDSGSGILWALLACKRFGQQLLDAFSPNGEHLGSVEIPHSKNLYGAICIPGGSHICLLDTGAGDLLWAKDPWGMVHG